MVRKPTTRAPAAPRRPVDRVLRSRSRTPVVPARTPADDGPMGQGAQTQLLAEAKRLQEAPRPSIQGNGDMTIAEASQTLNSTYEIISLSKPGQNEQRLRRSGRNRSKTPDSGHLIPEPPCPKTTRLETIVEQLPPDVPRPTKGSGLKRRLDHTTTHPTKRRARGACRLATSGTHNANEPKNSTGPHDLGASLNHNQPPGATAELIEQDNCTSIAVANVAPGQRMNDMTATDRTQSKAQGDCSTAQSSLPMDSTTGARRSMIPPQVRRTAAALPITSDTNSRKAQHPDLSLSPRNTATSPQPSTSARIKAKNLEFACNMGVATTPPNNHILSTAVAGSTGGNAQSRYTQLSPALPTVTSPDAPSCQESSSQPCLPRSRKRGQSPAATRPPPNKRVQKPATTVTPRHRKPVLVPTSEPKSISNLAPRSPTSTPATQAKQPTSPPAAEVPYKNTEQPTLMRYEHDWFTGQVKRRYYKPHKEVKLEPARKVELKEDYYPVPERPSFAEMVARQEDMYSEVKWDTPELTHEYEGPKDIMDGLTGFETEDEINAYFDRIEMEGPDLSYAPMRMPRKNVRQPKPHLCDRCVGGVEQEKLQQYWCECEDYCGDPVGEYEAAVIRPVREKKDKAKVKKRWW